MESYVVVDLETTGLNAKKDKIIEIGAIRVEDGKQAATFSTLVNPGRALSEKVQEITHITDTDLKKAPYIEEVIPKYLQFAKAYPLVGHSIIFDFSFLKRAAVNCGFSYEREGVDTLAIARACVPEQKSKSLVSLCGHFGIAYQPHRAFEDAKATLALYKILAEQFSNEENESLFQPKELKHQVKRERPATRFQKKYLLRLLNYHSLTAEYDIDRLTRSEASRYADSIISRYGRCPKEPYPKGK